MIHEVKEIYEAKTGEVLDGDRLMNRAFSCANNQILVIAFNQLQSLEEALPQKNLPKSVSES